MKMIRTLTGGTAFLLLLVISAPAQTSGSDKKHYDRNGLSFDYPADVTIVDNSTANGQDLVLTHSDQGAQIMIISRYERIDSAEQLTKARREVADKFVDTMAEEFKRDQAQVERTDVKTEVAGLKAPGVRLRAVLSGEAGNAEAYSLLLGKRFVLVTFIGSDKELAAGSSAWAMVRQSLQIANVTSANLFTKSYPNTGESR